MTDAGHVSIRFYEKLNDFLPKEYRKTGFLHSFRQRGSVKDLIESIGVPHTEIDLILVNGESVKFDYLVNDKDCISVYPAFESLDISSLNRLQPKIWRPARFVLDTHLGRLAAYLRMIGFDSLYRNDYDDATLASISADEQRVLLTCDRGLLMRNQVIYGCYVHERMPRRQFLEVIRRYRLYEDIQPFTRCMHCNGEINSIDKTSVISRLPPRTSECYDEFWQCTSCGKIYWKGTHYQRMQDLIQSLAQ